MSSLRASLHELATSFASSVLDAIRGASLEELLADAGGGARRGPGRPSKAKAAVTARQRRAPASPVDSPDAPPSRLPMRSTRWWRS
jgi:hypothetical protein